MIRFLLIFGLIVVNMLVMTVEILKAYLKAWTLNKSRLKNEK